MPKGANQKLKLLYLVKILQEETDEMHPLNASELIERLAKYEIGAERKSIYSDMDSLTDFGFDIIQKKSKECSGYYLASREFELPELKLLVDVVQSSRFITKKKSQELIKKLESMTCRYDAGKLQREVYVVNRVKNQNESIYYIVDDIYTAISTNHKIQFQYYEWTADKKMVFRREGSLYTVSPFALHWDDENYYLIAFDERDQMIKHYRVDKMMNLLVSDSSRDGIENFQGLDMAIYTQRTFGMFGGRDVYLTICAKNYLAGVFLDRFGKDISMQPQDLEHFRTRIQVCVSGQFYGWLTGLGPDVSIIAPAEICEEYKDYLKTIIEKYDRKS